MKRYEHGSSHEAFSGPEWLDSLRSKNPDMAFIDGLSTIATIARGELDVRYGPRSDMPLAYHNTTHSFEAAERGLYQLRIHHDIAPEYFNLERDPSLVVAALLLHDIYQLEEGAGENERRSAEYAKTLLPQHGFTQEEALLSSTMILATTAKLVDGKLTQPLLSHPASRHPLCLITASADSNAIAMEGLPRLIKDVINLTAEQHHTSPTRIAVEKPIDLTAMFSSQLTFFGNRLDTTGSDLRIFYDDDTATQIEARYKREFSSLGSEAIRAASMLNKTSLQIGEILKGEVIYKPEDITQLLIAYIRKNLKK